MAFSYKEIPAEIHRQWSRTAEDNHKHFMGALAGVRVKAVRVNTCISSFGLIGLEALSTGPPHCKARDIEIIPLAKANN